MLMAAGLVALSVALYAGTVHNPFVYDDATSVIGNPSIRGGWSLAAVLRYNITRPLTNLSYAIDYSFGQLDPFAFHVTNVLLHAVMVLLVFRLVRTIVLDARTRDETAAARIGLCTAVVFAVHPVLTEAVAYIAARADLLAGVFSVASFLAFRRALVHGGAVPLGIGAVLFVLAMGSKETAAVLPVVLFAYDVLVLRPLGTRDEWHRRLRRVHLPLLTVLIVAGVARAMFYVLVEQKATAGFTWTYVLVDLDAMARYIALLVLPMQQSFVHSVPRITTLWDWQVLRALAVLAVTFAVVGRRADRLVTFGVVWAVVWLLPGLLLILVAEVGQPIAERRAYIASCGLFLAAAVVVHDWYYPKLAASPHQFMDRRFAAGLAVVVLVLAGLSLQRNRLWSDPVLLWSDAVQKSPRTWLAQFGLAEAYQSVGDCEAAIPAFQRAIALVPQYPQAYDGLAACLTELGREDEARDVLRIALTRIPDAVQARVTLANLEAKASHFAEAQQLCLEARALAIGTNAVPECNSR
jgi:protein O-mannosyl-transferase